MKSKFKWNESLVDLNESQWWCNVYVGKIVFECDLMQTKDGWNWIVRERGGPKDCFKRGKCKMLHTGIKACEKAVVGFVNVWIKDLQKWRGK